MFKWITNFKLKKTSNNYNINNDNKKRVNIKNENNEFIKLFNICLKYNLPQYLLKPKQYWNLCNDLCHLRETSYTIKNIMEHDFMKFSIFLLIDLNTFDDSRLAMVYNLNLN